MRTHLVISALALTVACALPAGMASACDRDHGPHHGPRGHHAHMPRVERREHLQSMRIHDGIRRGELDPREARMLERGQRRIERAEDRAERDGRITPRERWHLSRMQDRQSARINRARHNGR